ncbi:MAG: hemin uptake protein HemP [Candidatus Devosia phytovorans]|uniref:Hemin uptake protein HemP n=1 Tax=Candidatus Devosia phytovorans TaxID=3121372 RepID=A0AAJ5VZR3_9HYPH|nr:hemin uptake protein HemP [Devosia sp.]WEK06469.1 MAG: hemin uptake protein HemP [Devosia sp.]
MSAKPLPEPEPESAPARELTSEELFAGKPEVLIMHRGAPYRLRITRQDKLILTK